MVEGSYIVHGYMVPYTNANVLAAVMAVYPSGIICLIHILHLVVKDVLGLGNTVMATSDAATLDMWSLLETSQHLSTHYSCSIKSACLIQETKRENDEPEEQLNWDLLTNCNFTYAMIMHWLHQRNWCRMSSPT